MLHFSGIHHQRDSAPTNSHHAASAVRAVTVVLAQAIRDQWVSVAALAVALWVATDLGTTIFLVAPLLAALAVLVNTVLDPAGAEVYAKTDITDQRV